MSGTSTLGSEHPARANSKGGRRAMKPNNPATLPEGCRAARNSSRTSESDNEHLAIVIRSRSLVLHNLQHLLRRVSREVSVDDLDQRFSVVPAEHDGRRIPDWSGARTIAKSLMFIEILKLTADSFQPAARHRGVRLGRHSDTGRGPERCRHGSPVASSRLHRLHQ